MEREQIIKALECCKSANTDDCNQCVYKGKANGANDLYITCINLLVADTLTLIKELTEDNKSLNDTITSLKAEHCIVCGDVIPEGQQVCFKCEKGKG